MKLTETDMHAVLGTALALLVSTAEWLADVVAGML